MNIEKLKPVEKSKQNEDYVLTGITGAYIIDKLNIIIDELNRREDEIKELQKKVEQIMPTPQ